MNIGPRQGHDPPPGRRGDAAPRGPSLLSYLMRILLSGYGTDALLTVRDLWTDPDAVARHLVTLSAFSAFPRLGPPPEPPPVGQDYGWTLPVNTTARVLAPDLFRVQSPGLCLKRQPARQQWYLVRDWLIPYGYSQVTSISAGR